MDFVYFDANQTSQDRLREPQSGVAIQRLSGLLHCVRNDGLCKGLIAGEADGKSSLSRENSLLANKSHCYLPLAIAS
jgi:hypothetical protein